MIQTTEVDNSPASTRTPDGNYYACENTYDKVFLLSYAEAMNAEYGFDNDTEKIKVCTDYAMSQCCYRWRIDNGYKGNCFWWLRTPRYSDCAEAKFVEERGEITSYYVSSIARGVAPAIHLNLS